MTSKMTLENGHQVWRDAKGRCHRDGDLPAIIWTDGTQWWSRDGLPHRDGDLPAVIGHEGSQYWYRDGKRHRDGDLPATLRANGTQGWYREGKRHREGGLPAIIWANGTQEWYCNGQCIYIYYPDFGCFVPESRTEALERLDAKNRPFSRALYLADIDRLWP